MSVTDPDQPEQQSSVLPDIASQDGEKRAVFRKSKGKKKNKKKKAARHYSHIDEVPQAVRKYWHQRYHLFSLYDEGVFMTDKTWYGVTPEPVAIAISTFLTTHSSPGKRTLIDLFAGCGGNTIPFALSGRWDKVIGIDIDANAIACAQHNAEIYDAPEGSVQWLIGDSFEILKSMPPEEREGCIVFASPPWGGPGYRDESVFDVLAMEPYGLGHLQERIREITGEYALFLPRTSDLEQIAGLMGEGERARAVQYCVEGASKGMCVYYGSMSNA